MQGGRDTERDEAWRTCPSFPPFDGWQGAGLPHSVLLSSWALPGEEEADGHWRLCRHGRSDWPRHEWLVFGLPSAIGFSLVGLFLSLAALIYVSLAYRNGKSVGKRVMGTQVVRVDGSPISWASNFWLRTFLVKRIIGTVGSMTSGLLSMVNYLWPLWDRDAQVLHDRMVGTCVVKVPPTSRPTARFRA